MAKKKQNTFLIKRISQSEYRSPDKKTKRPDRETAQYLDLDLPKLTLKKAVKTALIDLIDSDVALIPETTVKADLDTSLKVFKLLEMLEDLDDTQNVTSNIEFAEGMLDQLD